MTAGPSPSRARTSLAFVLALVLALALGLAAAPPAAAADEPVDLDAINRIRAEGLHESQAMDLARHLTETLGPRLTGSPGLRAANDWTRAKFAEWGLADARLEGFPFGRGWSFERAAVHQLAPHRRPLPAVPLAWSPGTGVPVRGVAMKVKIEKVEDLEEFRGKLAGKILFLDEPGEIEEREVPGAGFGPRSGRYDDEGLEELQELTLRQRPDDFRRRARERYRLGEALRPFLVAEGAVATVGVSSWPGTLVRVGGNGAYREGSEPGVPALVMAMEQYNSILRQLDDGGEVELEIEVVAAFHDEDAMAYNTVAEIPGSDPGAGVVMAGAHLDSWHAGQGAADNAAGCAMVMEAARILRTAGLQPRRTIRFALWGGEEQGLLGSRAYVGEHFASRPGPDDPEERKLPEIMWDHPGPLTVKPGHSTLSAYFNLDNGGGKIRGIYAQENSAVVPIFTAWLAPFRDLGATTVSTRNTRGTDHLSFDRIGLPGFQFIQDPLEYSLVNHHTNADSFDYLRDEDLRQAATILASFLYHAAQRPDLLPRKPMPKDEHAPPPAPPAGEPAPAEEPVGAPVQPPEETSPAEPAVGTAS